MTATPAKKLAQQRLYRRLQREGTPSIAKTCRCEQPWVYHEEDGEARCANCGFPRDPISPRIDCRICGEPTEPNPTQMGCCRSCASSLQEERDAA